MDKISHDVFISYSSKDRKIADIVCGSLEQRKIRVWMAPRDLRPGNSYGAEIVHGIGGARMMVLIFSGNSFKSAAVRKEIERAISKSKTIVPFCIEEIELDEEWEYYISSSHWLDAINDNMETAIQKLIKVVESNIISSSSSSGSIGSESASSGIHSSGITEKIGRSLTYKKYLIPLVLLVVVISLITGGIFLGKRGKQAKRDGVPSEQVEDNTAKIQSTSDKFSFTDERDGQTYKALRIGNQIWMAENLNYDAGQGSWVYENDKSNARKYGKLYNWEIAKNLSPEGWHIPSYDEWLELKDYIRDQGYKSMKEGKALKSEVGWDEFEDQTVMGTDEFGFAALPGGYRGRDGQFMDLGRKGYWWTSTNYVNNCILSSENAYLTLSFYDSTDAFSIRCIKDAD
jgi:uncharacterized protein (TIGR02145 family)